MLQVQSAQTQLDFVVILEEAAHCNCYKVKTNKNIILLIRIIKHNTEWHVILGSNIYVIHVIPEVNK